MQLLECQVAAHSADLVSSHGDINRLEESVEVAERQLADALLASLSLNGQRDENCCRLG